MAKNRKNLDPLFQLFEHFLVTRSYEDSSAFTKQLAEQYLAYLDSTPAHVPFGSRTSVLEDLEAEAKEMLVKKMYGVVRPEDYQNSGQVMKVSQDVKSFDYHPLPADQEETTAKKQKAE